MLVNTSLGVLPEATMSLSSESGTIDCGGSTTLTVTTNSDGALSCLSSNNTVATCSVSGTTITINGVSGQSGSATITISQAAGTNYAAAPDKSYSLTISSSASWHYYIEMDFTGLCPAGCPVECNNAHNTSVWSCTDYFSDPTPPSSNSLTNGASCWCYY